jgi:hypothetical protein
VLALSHHIKPSPRFLCSSFLILQLQAGARPLLRTLLHATTQQPPLPNRDRAFISVASSTALHRRDLCHLNSIQQRARDSKRDTLGKFTKPSLPPLHRLLQHHSAVMISAMFTKVTSLGSQSGSETQHQSTPVAEAMDSGAVVPLPPMDFAAVTKILEPIQESLNESAHEATYPSPPGNTPLVGSPAPSTRPGVYGRARGFSAIGDRLAQLKLDDRKTFRRRQTCVTCSGRSVCTSAAEENDDSDMASNSEVLSDGCKDKGCDIHPGRSMVSSSSFPLGPRLSSYCSRLSCHQPTHRGVPVIHLQRLA